jgi:hypothetical protein
VRPHAPRADALRAFVRERRSSTLAPPTVARAEGTKVLLRLPKTDRVRAARVVDVVVLNVVVFPPADRADLEGPGRGLRQREVAATGARVTSGHGGRYAAISPFDPVSGVGYKLTEAV